MKTFFAVIALAELLVSCSVGCNQSPSVKSTTPSVIGSDGIEYVMASPDMPQPDGTAIRETWQRADAQGTNQTDYYRIRQTPGDTNAPTFVIATRKP